MDQTGLRRQRPLIVLLVTACVLSPCPEAQEHRSIRANAIDEPVASAQSPEAELRRAYTLRGKLTERDFLSAVRLFVGSARQFLTAGRREKAALAEMEAGDTYQMMSRYRQALGAYDRSLEFSGNQPGSRCAAQARIARTDASLGRNSEAMRILREAVAACEASSDQAALAYALEVEGEAQFWAGNTKDASQSLSRARRLASEAGQRRVEAQSMLMQAQIVHTTDPQEAGHLIGAALNIWSGSGDEYEAARANLAMAFFAADEGKFAAAQCHCRKALDVFDRIADRDNAAIGFNILGLVSNATGDADGAERFYRRARNDFMSAEDDLGEAESLIGLTAALVRQNRYSGLMPLYQREIFLGQRTNSPGLLASAHLGMGDLYMHRHQYDAAETNYHLALAEYESGENPYGQGLALMQLAALRAAEGKPREALSLLDRAYALKEGTGEIEDRARIQYARARLYYQSNRIEDARSEIEKTVSIVESQRLRVSKFDSRAQYLASVHDYYSLYIRILMALDLRNPGQGYSERALEAAEKSKVRAFLDQLRNAEPGDPCAGSSDAGSPAEAFDEKASELRSDPEVAQALSVQQMQAQIADPDTVLVEYAIGDDRSFAWKVESGAITVQELAPAAEIGDRIQKLQRALAGMESTGNESPLDYLRRRDAAQNELSRQLSELGKILLGDLHLPPGKRLLIVPDGPLQGIPFAALNVPGDGGDRGPLIRHHEVTILPSASVLSALRAAAVHRRPPLDEIAVFADPVFAWQGNAQAVETGAIAQTTRAAEVSFPSPGRQAYPTLSALPGSKTEGLAIQEIIKRETVKLFSGFDANRDVIMGGAIDRARIIHFATHGFADSRRPERSGLALSMFTGSGDLREGHLRLSDIYRLHLSADLVVLSACDSSLGKDLGSEGVIGLPRGFLYAGARSVIASMWKVDDEATAALMGALYVRIERGENFAQALRGAQLELLNGRYRAPWYWAAFALQGDFR